MPGPEVPQPSADDIAIEPLVDELPTIPGTGGGVDLEATFYGGPALVDDDPPGLYEHAEPASTEETTGSAELEYTPEESRKHKILRVAGGIGFLVMGLATATGKYPGTDYSADVVRYAMAGAATFSGATYLERSIKGAADRVRNRFGRKNQETVDPADS